MGATFDNAVLTGVDVEQLRVSPGALANCVVDPSTAALKRSLELIDRLAAGSRWVLSDGADGRAAMLDDEDLRPLGLAFEGRVLAAISCRRVCAVGMSFVGAQLQGANFDGADLRDADFRDCDLRGASFRGANLRHARFVNADVQPLPLAHGGAQPVDLDGANHAPDCFAFSRKA